MARREELGHPLGTVTSSTDEDAAAPPAAAAAGPSIPELFVLEVGSEELPTDDVLAGMAQLRWVCCYFVAVMLYCGMLLCYANNFGSCSDTNIVLAVVWDSWLLLHVSCSCFVACLSATSS
jgi:hypothetical protein